MKRKKIVRISIYIVLGILLYWLIFALVPYMKFRKVNNDFKDKFNVLDFYGNEDQFSIDRASIVEESQEALDIRLRMISQAKNRIILSSFSIKNDRVSKEIFAALYNAAERGVKVQIIVDGVTGNNDMKHDPMDYVLGTHQNAEIRYYNMLNLLKPWNFNGRLHDKYVIVDDKLLLLGGRNTSNYFMGEYNPEVLSYDRDILVYNTLYGTKESQESVIYDTIDYFENIWNHRASKTVFDKVSKKKKAKVAAAEQELREIYADMVKERPDIFEDGTDYCKITVPVNKISLIYNPINTTPKEPWVWYQIKQLMLNAEKRVYIQTPYAVMNKEMYSSLKEIGKDLEKYDMLINSIAVGDNVMGSSDYKFNKKKVMKTGITIHEFQGEHSMHNKSFLIDYDMSVVGSFNMDMRSAYIDTETMLVIHGEEFNKLLEKNINAMEDKALALDEKGKYIPKEGISPVKISSQRNIAYTFTSVIFQLFRFLL